MINHNMINHAPVLKKKLTWTYLLFICAVFAALFLSLNIVSEKIFNKFVRAAISERNAEIIHAVSEQYRPMQKRFDIAALENAGMIFMHDGFIIDVENERGEKVWDARDMDMEHCVAALKKISERMNEHGKKSEVQNISFPLFFAGSAIGSVNIASVGPFFYTEAQSEFISHLNTTLTAIFFISIILCVIVCVSYTALNAAINKLTRKLCDAQNQQKQLTGDIAHEIRTPLACIQGTIEAVIDGVWEASTERLNSILDEVKRLTKLSEDLQVLSSFESGNITLNKTQFDAAELLQICAGQFRAAAEEKGLSIITRLIPAQVFADYDRTKQVVINLLSNAVKYTDTGTITISIEKPQRGCAEKIIIKIADTGRGISKEDLPRIFERFYRAEKSRNRVTGGAGVGLTIAAAICAAQGWEISAESEGNGSVFMILLCAVKL